MQFSTREAEPVEWRPPPPLRDRLRRAIAVPAAAGVVVFIVAVLVAVVLVWTQPHEVATSTTAAASDGGPAGERNGAAGGAVLDGAAGAPDSRTATDTVFVHVVGEVRSSGVVELPAGARVEAAIAAAGGATEAAELSAVNLARTVVDGEQIRVPDALTAASLAAAAPPGGTGGAGAGAFGGPLNLNTADAAALETLTGVGPALAGRIVAWREANGRFESVDQLLEVSGIGAKKLDGLRASVVAQ